MLGVISALRPATSQAAVFALLKAPSARRSLLAFCFAGIVVSVAIGLVLVLALDGTVPRGRRSTFSSVFELIAGVAALSFAIGVWRGQLTRPRVPAGGRRGSGISERLRRPSALTAAAAGVVTHVPGLIYLVALNSIAARQPSRRRRAGRGRGLQRAVVRTPARRAGARDPLATHRQPLPRPPDRLRPQPPGPDPRADLRWPRRLPHRHEHREPHVDRSGERSGWLRTVGHTGSASARR